MSVYRERKEFCRRCATEIELHRHGLRGFCRSHLRRGDCGLDDADANYEVVSGPGPDDVIDLSTGRTPIAGPDHTPNDRRNGC